MLKQEILTGLSDELEHHKVANVLKLATVNAEIDELKKPNSEEGKALTEEANQLEAELNTQGVSVRLNLVKPFSYSIGLLMGKELVISSLPEDETVLIFRCFIFCATS